MNGSLIPADSTILIPVQINRPEFHIFCVEGQQAVCKQITNACQIFQRFGRLYGAKYAGNSSQNTCL